jgi:predicted DNA-binding transcriptional regulator AlpA
MAGTLRPEDILTSDELAAKLKVRKSWVYEQTRSRSRNPLPRLNMGRYLRFDWTAVVQWLTQAPEKTPAEKRLRK